MAVLGLSILVLSEDLKANNYIIAMARFKQFCLHNDDGARITLSELGACIRSFYCRDKHGADVDIVLGFDTDAEYLLDSTFMGAVVGPYANRIGGGCFQSASQSFQLDVDDSGHTLHGSGAGIHHKHWQGQHFPSANSVWFTLELQDGEGGFPGHRRLEVRYQLIDSDLRVTYSCVTDQDTIINLTQHSYFNLAGHSAGSIEDTELCVRAAQITEVDGDLIPTGRLLQVEGTPLDFQRPKTIASGLYSDHPLMQATQGYDHNYVLSNHWDQEQSLHLAASARSAATGIELLVLTDQPGMQFYSGSHIPENLQGKAGAVYNPLQGFCLETQNFPDAPNHPKFPSPWLKAGQVWRSETVYRWSIDND